MKIIVVQPVVPSYRIGFFERLNARLPLQVHASRQDLGVLTARTERASWERALGPMRRVFPGLFWQSGALSIPIARGDVVVVSGAPRCLSNLALLLKAKAKGAKSVWWGHYRSATSHPARAALRMQILRLADAVLFYTDHEVAEYLSTRPGRRKPVAALNNGIEIREIVPLRAAYDPGTRPGDLLFVGRLTRKAELDHLLDALCRPPCETVRLDVIGSGEEEDRLRRRCDALGLGDRVIWHRGTADETRIAEIANRCKLFVYPGSVGLGLIHAFAYGLPALVHDEPGRHMPEIAALDQGANGATFKRGDAVSLSETISALLADADRLSMMSAAALRTTERSFNAADMTERMVRLVRSLQPATAEASISAERTFAR